MKDDDFKNPQKQPGREANIPKQDLPGRGANQPGQERKPSKEYGDK